MCSMSISSGRKQQTRILSHRWSGSTADAWLAAESTVERSQQDTVAPGLNAGYCAPSRNIKNPARAVLNLALPSMKMPTTASTPDKQAQLGKKQRFQKCHFRILPRSLCICGQRSRQPFGSWRGYSLMPSSIWHLSGQTRVLLSTARAWVGPGPDRTLWLLCHEVVHVVAEIESKTPCPIVPCICIYIYICIQIFLFLYRHPVIRTALDYRTLSTGRLARWGCCCKSGCPCNKSPMFWVHNMAPDFLTFACKPLT